MTAMKSRLRYGPPRCIGPPPSQRPGSSSKAPAACDGEPASRTTRRPGRGHSSPRSLTLTESPTTACSRRSTSASSTTISCWSLRNSRLLAAARAAHRASFTFNQVTAYRNAAASNAPKTTGRVRSRRLGGLYCGANRVMRAASAGPRAAARCAPLGCVRPLRAGAGSRDASPAPRVPAAAQARGGFPPRA